MKVVQGIAAAPGVAIGKTLWLRPPKLIIEQRAASPEVETERLKQAIDRVKEDVQQMVAGMQDHPEEAAIFEAHLMMLDDPDLLALAQTRLDSGAEYAWDSAIQHYAAQLEALESEYFQARAADVRDIGQQVLRVLLQQHGPDLSHLAEPVILLARDLTPSDTGRLDKSKLLGFATQEGSATAHTAILAKALGLPAVVGVGEALESIPDGALVVLDGTRGVLIVNPDADTMAQYIIEGRQDEEARQAALAQAQTPAITTDGRRVEVVANIGNLEDAQEALKQGAEGVGLLRTEFLYLDRKMPPTREEQVAIYRAIFQVIGDRPVVIRTLDIGGDKAPSYMDLGEEANPFLGWRAIRVCLDQPEIFMPQLEAILLAAAGHDIRIMFPMIATLEELRRARAMLDEARVNTGVDAPVQVGIMVEIPSVVQMADIFAREVDFFSVGTNDLTQYTFAVDRTNPKVAGLADACHPAILRQIHHVIQAAHDRGIWVGVCGELAGDPDAIPILLGLELDEFSMTPAAIPRAKQLIRRWSLPDARTLARKVLQLDSAQAVREWVRHIESQKEGGN